MELLCDWKAENNNKQTNQTKAKKILTTDFDIIYPIVWEYQYYEMLFFC